MEDFSSILENISKYPENEKCIDCNNSNPGWISFPFALFICAKCAKNHKQLKYSVSSIELGDFSSHEIELLKIGGNKKFLDIIKEYKIPLNDPLFKYKTIIASYYKVLLEKKVDIIEKKINEEEINKLIELRPTYEEGIKENINNINFLDIKNENLIKDNDKKKNNELNNDINSAINSIGGWINFFGNKIKDTAEATIYYAGLSDEAKNAKQYIINNIQKINENEIVKTTKNKISNISNKTEGFINENTKKISENNMVKNIINNVNLGYSNLKNATENLVNNVKKKIDKNDEIKKIEDSNENKKEKEKNEEDKKEEEKKEEEIDISIEIKKDF